MRSSTSSSSEAPASGALGRVWWVALLAAGVLLAGAEWGWRVRGFQPSVKDTPELWSLERARASEGDGSAVVMLGSSRFQVGLVPEVLSQALGGARVMQLSISGSSSLPVLEDLAADERFRGLVLCEVSPTLFFSVEPNEVRARPASYVARHAHRTFVEDWETALRLPFQEHLVVLLSAVQPKGVLHHLLVNRTLPPPPLNRTRADRHQPSHFEGVDVAALRHAWERRYQDAHGRTPEAAELEALLERVSAQVERIRSRGGEVVFVRMVSSGTVRRIEDTRYPRALYWERLLERTGSQGLSFEDSPALARFECPDGSHLDSRAATGFTHLLGQELLRQAPGGLATRTP
ncbi:hypothetical protein [Archangium lipolyticum]|uniref:hypothetical protein n=1 Tax=Archangium lipolyticum TaxID=2970465 RepID=UPI00214A552B|nr:hypothetical protein [Archangium lipolyticum]